MMNERYSRNSVIVALLCASTLVAFLRFYGIKSEFYQGIAHIFVGTLIGGWLWSKFWCGRTDKFPGILALILTFAVEVPMALWTFIKG
jgi:hypothetical protein